MSKLGKRMIESARNTRLRLEAEMDIVERLQSAGTRVASGEDGELFWQAADEIERLQHDNDQLRKAASAEAGESERLRERVAILEAELRVAYKLPAAIDAALSGKVKDGSG